MVIRKGFYNDGHFDSKVDGEYVKYEDYAALENNCQESITRMVREIRALRQELALYKDNCQ